MMLQFGQKVTIHTCLGTSPWQQRLLSLEEVEHPDVGCWLLQCHLRGRIRYGRSWKKHEWNSQVQTMVLKSNLGSGSLPLPTANDLAIFWTCACRSWRDLSLVTQKDLGHCKAEKLLVELNSWFHCWELSFKKFKESPYLEVSKVFQKGYTQ